MEIQVLLTLLENNKQEWGISFDGINPNKNKYVKCESKKDAYKLKLLIEKHFSSILGNLTFNIKGTNLDVVSKSD